MLYDIYRVGKVISGMEQTGMDPMLVPETLSNITNVLTLNFKQEEASVQYRGVNCSEYSREGAEKFLLRKASANGPNYGPSAQLTENEKTLMKKTAAWFKEAASEGEEASQKIFLKIFELITENKEAIIEEMKEQRPTDKKAKVLLTVRIDGRFPGEEERFFTYYSKKVRNKLIGKENHTGTCCLCGSKDIALLPKVDVFKFYTLDKPGFISGGFSEDDVWRNCPVCITCEPVLREGKKFMLEHLKFRFSGFEYYIIPSSTCSDEKQEVLLGSMLDRISQKSFSFKKESGKDFEGLCNDIFEELSEESDINSFRIIFFKKENAAERILLDMKDIFPSRFSLLYSVKYKVERTYGELIKEKFGFRYFRQYLSKTEPLSRGNDLDAVFLALMHAVFTRQIISMDILLPHYMRSIRRAFLNGEYFFHTVMRAWIGIKYLQEIGCMKYKKEEFPMDEKLQKTLEPYDIGLDTKLKKALFLTGVLAQKVMNIQARNLNGATPFTKNFKDFRLRITDVQRLITEEIKLMQQYERYSKVSESIAQGAMSLFFESDSKKVISVDEINFYIAGGVVLSDKIYEQLKEE